MGGVVALHLANNALVGEIPPELDSLVNARTLDFSDNILTGDIPSRLLDMDSWVYLRVSGNRLNGDPEDIERPDWVH